MRYTGLSIGDTAKLEKAHVQGCRIRTYRKKTREDVFARVPSFVVEALNSAVAKLLDLVETFQLFVGAHG